MEEYKIETDEAICWMAKRFKDGAMIFKNEEFMNALGISKEEFKPLIQTLREEDYVTKKTSDSHKIRPKTAKSADNLTRPNWVDQFVDGAKRHKGLAILIVGSAVASWIVIFVNGIVVLFK